MKEILVRSEEEAQEAIRNAAKDGLRPAVMSNAGLPAGVCRITFLPESVFKKSK